MKAPFFIEVLVRGEVRHRQRVDSLPIRIGRGYDNDVILDDRHVSANHVIVERSETGGLEVHDLGSRNGVVYQRKRRGSLPVDGNTVFRLGHTNLRIRSADFSVASELKDTTLHGWEGWPPALAGLVMMVLLSLWNTWISDFENAEVIHYVTGLAGLLGIGLLWCGGWTLANRLFAGHTRFGRHLFIAASGLVAIELVTLVLSFAVFAFSLETVSRYANHISLAIAAAMVYFHLVTINPNNTRRFAIAAVALLFLGSGLTMMFNYQSRGHLSDELYMNDLYSPALRLSKDKTVEQFMTEAKNLKSGIDAERSKVLHDDGEEDSEPD